MAARIDSGIDPKFFEEFKQAIATVYELREAMILTSKQQVNIEVNGAASKTLVDLAGNEMKLAEAVKETKVGYDSLEVSLNRVASLKAQYNGSTDTLIGLEKKLNSAEKELELAMLARAKADTEASKQYLINRQAEKVAAETLFIERKRQIAEELELDRLIREEEKQKQIEYAKTAAIQKEAKASALINTPLVITNEHQTGTNAANADGTVVNAAQTAELEQQTQATKELTVATTQANTAKAGFVAMTEAEIVAEREAETTMIAMAAQLKLLQNEYKALSATQRASAEGIALNTQIQQLDKEVKALDASLGNSQRNVGNYGSAFENATKKAMSLDVIAGRLITSFMRMGIHFLAFTIIIKGIEWVIEKMGLFESKTSAAGKALQKYNDTLKSIEETQAGAAAQEIAHINVLTKVAADTTESMKNRIRAVEELQKTYPDRFGALTKEAILEGNVADAIKRTSQELINRAAAQAAEKKLGAAAEKEYDLTKQQAIATKELAKATVELQDAEKDTPFLSNSAAGSQFGVANSAVSTAQLKAAQLRSNLDNINQGIIDAKAEQLVFASDAQSFAAKAGQTLFGKDPKMPKTNSHASAEYQGAKELNDAVADLKKQQIEQDAAANEEIFKNDKASLEDRLLAYQNYESDLIYIAEAEKNKKIANANAELKEIEKLQNDGKKKDAEQDKDLTDRHAAALVKKQAAEEEYQAKVASITSKGRAAIQQINDDEEKKQYDAVINATKQVVGSYQAAYDKEKALLDEKHTSGAISEKKYQEDILELNKKYAKEILQAQIDTIKASIPKFAEGTKEAEDLLNKLVELQKQLGQTKSNKPKSGVLGFTDEDLKLLGEINSEANTYLDATQNLNKALDAASQKRINNLQAEINAIEKKKNADVEAVNASLLSEDEKQKRIAEINAKAQAQEDLQNQKINDEKRKAAERDKALAIAQIVIKTALAVVNQLGAGDPYTAIPRAIAVGVLGAAELAAAIAEPIPEFWKGTDNAPKGLAKVGEKGPELIIPKHGKPWLADKEMIAYLHGGEQIKTHTETMEIMKMFGLGMPMARHGQRDGTGELLEGLRENAESIVGAIKSKRFPGTVQRPSWYHDFHTYNSKS